MTGPSVPPAHRQDASGTAGEDAGAASPAQRPLFGWLGQIAAVLFPVAPGRRPRSSWGAAGVVAGHVAAVGIGAGVLLIRQAGTPSWSTVWAEDGWVFLPRAMFHPWSSLLQQQAGYLQLVPQLIADVVARFPLRFAAAGFALGGVLVASCCAVFVYHASSGHIRRPGLRVLLAASVLLLPTALVEIANSGVDAPWYLMYALFWALIWRPRSGSGRAMAAVLALATMASNILNLLYLPLVAARAAAVPRARDQAVTFGWLAGLCLQVVGIVESKEPHRLGSVPGAFHFYGQHVLVAAVAGWSLALRLQAMIGVSACIAAAAVVVAAVAGWVAWRGDSRIRVFTVTALAMGMILAIIPALIRYWVSTYGSGPVWVPGSRFTTSAILLIDAIAIAGVDARLRHTGIPRRRLWHAGAVLLLVAGLGIGWCTSFRYANLRSAGVPWPRAHAGFAQRHHSPRGGVAPPQSPAAAKQPGAAR